MQLIRYNIPYQPQISILRIPCGMQQLTDSGNLKHKDISILRIPCGMQPIIAVQFRFALQFSILRIPHGMQRCQSRPKSTPPLFQSYASLAGCNHRIVTFDIGNINFNLTHPLRDATAILYSTRIIFLCVIVHFYWYGLFNAVVAYLLHRIHPQSLLFIGAKLPVNLCVLDVRTSHIQYYYTIFYISVLTLTFFPRLKQVVLRRNLINKKSNKRNTPLVALFYFGYL